MATTRSGTTAGGAGNGSRSQLSVVVPAYNETDNIQPLCERLFKATKEAGIEAELLIMDDESPGSEATKVVVEKLRADYPIRVHCRRRSEGRGLSSAVLLGFDMAKYENILCMDADLQHEPEAVPAVADPVMSGAAEFSVGSRHVGGGGLVLARGRQRCNPIGFKIGLEIMARCRCASVQDVGITFRERVAGESKLTMKQNVQYLEQLAMLYWDRYAPILVLLLVAILVVLYLLANALFF
ncbi:uncharacterized protein MONBRDRAFT_11614 [Monosiga brevicollis MX1]|uniref:dolichyl-phosphate beta-D-mannosyltransferase n=1 Tax=Monosiga brevicollis TaxID=81824 RepID=A9V9S9_MONBE|nr:uncharacterized protein MONBRDRAFT_11614 [Monosiga brevicollis MX1]EDQ85777.1 predicted protein [Monosiga brevicollis MX1]|eukprot:XP_001749492.1 hypothetical protein [Monosiga brevicollis MX1]